MLVSLQDLVDFIHYTSSTDELGALVPEGADICSFRPHHLSYGYINDRSNNYSIPLRAIKLQYSISSGLIRFVHTSLTVDIFKDRWPYTPPIYLKAHLCVR